MIRGAARRAACSITLLTAAACLFGSVGCSRQGPPRRYEVLPGTVESLRADTGELTVQRGALWSSRPREISVPCLLTNDTEVYINDKLSRFDALAIGDHIELIGYHEANARAERFVVSFAYVSRDEPIPPEPDLTPATTAPTSQPQEN